MAEPKVFLFTDLESSTRRWEADEEAMSRALVRHDSIVWPLLEGHGAGWCKHTGDGVCAAFDLVDAAVEAAAAIQSALRDDDMLRIRIGVHIGAAETRDGDWFGPTLNRCARLMGAANGGQTLLSGDAAGVLHKPLAMRDLGEHRLRDLGSPMRIYQLGDEAFPPLHSLSTMPTNLPAQRSTFLGRTAELARLDDELTSGRLVTLIGVGGTGKTRLALQAAAEASVRFPDGTFVAELAALQDPLQVPRAVAEAVGAFDALTEVESEDQVEASRAATEGLTRWLSGRRVLLVLDNCEHLIGAVAALTDRLLAAADGLVVVATSREPLMVDGEHVFPVPGIDDAVGLFADRARSVRPDFVLSDTNIDQVVALCARLDHIPLAIELAAARLRALSLDQICDRLDDTFRLLTGGSRTSLERHQTLAAAIRWSHDLLTPEEQILFRRLGVFAGGCTLDAIAIVCAAEDPDRDVIDLVQQLVDKSLLVFDDDGAHRYRLLEIVRQYAAGLLAESDEADLIRGRHLEWAIALARPAANVLAIDWAYCARLPPDHGNLERAFTWAVESRNGSAALRLAGATAFYWRTIGAAVLARQWLGQALDLTTDADQPLLRAAVLSQYANLRQLAGDYRDTVEGFEVAAERFRDLGAPLGVAYCLFGIGRALDLAGRSEESVGVHEEAAALFDQVGDRVGLAWQEFNRAGHLFLRGDRAGAASLIAPLLELGPDAVGVEPHAFAVLLDGLSRMLDGDVERGRDRYRRGLELQAASIPEHAYVCYAAATVELEPGGEADLGEELLRTSLEETRTAGALEFLQGQLEAAAVVAARRGALTVSAELFEAADGIPARTGIHGGAMQQWGVAEAARAQVRARLDPAELAEAATTGRAWSLSQAAEAAIEAVAPSHVS